MRFPGQRPRSVRIPTPRSADDRKLSQRKGGGLRSLPFIFGKNNFSQLKEIETLVQSD